jgi:hypothetical protein
MGLRSGSGLARLRHVFSLTEFRAKRLPGGYQPLLDVVVEIRQNL